MKQKLFILLLSTLSFNIYSQSNVNYVPFVFNSDLSLDIRDFSSKDVGNTEGMLNVTNGAAVYTLPIMNFERCKNCNPAPEIKIVYNSMSGDGLLGRGWSINGLSSIKLTGKKVATHGIAEPSCTVNYDFELDGILLRYDANGSTPQELVFRADNEDFNDIKGYVVNGNIEHFIVINKEGWVKQYGIYTKNKVSNLSGYNTVCNSASLKSIEFYLDKVTFPDGNERNYSYTNGLNHEIAIETISDNFQSLNFYYNTRQDYYETYKNGVKIKHDLLLNSVELNNINGDKVRKYHFKYSTDNISSYLSYIQEEGSDGSYLIPLKIKYGDRQGNNYTTSSLNSMNTNIANTSKANVLSGDFDGNGITDYLIVDYDPINQQQVTKFKIFKLNATNNYSLAINYTLLGNPKISFPSNGVSHFMTSDFNGDGRDDILVHFLNSNNEIINSTIFYTNYDASGFDIVSNSYPVRTSNPSGNFQKINANNNFNLIGDFDGDGNSDYILMTSNGTADRLFINFPKKSIFNEDLQEGISSVSSTWAQNKLHVIDFNGDGKSDIVEFNSTINPNTIKMYTVNKNGNTWEAKCIYSSNTPTPNHNYFVGDFNGDGKTDLFAKKGNNTNDLQSIFFSTGNNFVEKSFPMQMNIDLNKIGNCEGFFKILDLNGDGKSDIIYNQGNETDVFFSKGYDFHNVRYTGLNFGNKKCNITGGDFNGDGKSDFITIDNITSSQVTFFNHYFFGHKNEKLVEKIANSYNNIISIQYKNLSNSQGLVYVKNYQEANSMLGDNNIYVQYPLNVVSSVSLKNSNGQNSSNYNYTGAVFNKNGLGFLGFRKIEISDYNKDKKTTTYTNFNHNYNIENIYLNDLSYTDRISDGMNLNYTSNSYNMSYLANNRYWLKLVHTSTYDYLKGENGQLYQYDNNGNVVLIESSDLLYNQKQIFNFGANATNRPALPSIITLEQSRNYAASSSVSSYFEYDTKYRPIKKIDFYNLPKACTTLYEYNNIGNITKETKTSNRLLPRMVEKIYDPTGIYITEIKNAKGQSQFFDMDLIHHKPKQITDVNGLNTLFFYDGWGRRAQTFLQSGKEINEVFGWNMNYSNNDEALYYNKTYTNTNSKEQFVYYDIYGRAIKKENDVSLNNKLIEETEFNDMNGNEVKKHFKDGNGNYLYGMQFFYDKFNRIIQSNKLYGANGYNSTTIYTKNYIKYGYDWKEEETIGSKTTYKEYNRRRELIEASENGKNLLTYEYNNFGKNTRVKLGSKILIENEYDIYGNQTKLVDKNASTQTYEYNAYKELIRQTNSNGGNQRFEYDVLGRKVKELLPEGTIDYTYYPTGSGSSTNLIKEINGYNFQNKESYLYDNMGRLIEKKQYINGRNTPFVSLFQYDIDDNLIQKTSPSAKSYHYTFDNYGNLQEIKKGSIDIFKLVELSALGQLKKYNLGATPVERFYDDLQRLTKIESVNFEEEYNWDNTNNNLNSKKDWKHNIQTDYVYDNFERLLNEQVTVPGFSNYNKTISYDDMGNIVQKDEVGVYDYHTNKHNAVKTISQAENFLPYKQDIIYNSVNRPTKLSQNNNELYYGYNHNYERVSATLYTGTTVQYKRYYSGDLETTYDANGNLLYSLDYIRWNNNLVAIDIEEPNPFVVPIGTGGGNSGSPVPAFNSTPLSFNNSGVWYVHTDYQNNIRVVFKSPYANQYEMNYDAWGNYRDVVSGQSLYEKPTSLPAWLYRGYTSHEYLPEFRLYNMNARLYDPHIGRFLSPDNYVQMPNSMQSYNRYSYCINNPTKYNDPSGNFFIIDDFIIGTVRGMVDFVTSGFSDWGALTTGFVQAGNCAMIYGGLFTWSSTDNFLSALGRIVSRLTWELPQTLGGVAYSQTMNTFGQVESVGYAYGATVVRHTNFQIYDIDFLDNDFTRNNLKLKQREGSGMTLGSFINGGNDIRADKNNVLFQHEYGHYLQSRAVGAGFLLMFGLPSIMSAAGNGTHHDHFAEQDANARSKAWFDENTGGVDWSLYNPINNPNLRVNYSNIFSHIF